jgi:hypothetical protein
VAGAEEFTTVTGGVELRLGSRHLVAPYVRLEAGSLSEDQGAYFVAGVGAGLSVRVRGRFALRAGATWSAHSVEEGGSGPTCYFGGFEYRW